MIDLNVNERILNVTGGIKKCNGITKKESYN